MRYNHKFLLQVRRCRQVALAPMAVPHNLADIEIPLAMRITRTNPAENFLLADSGAADPKRVIMFASARDLRRLADSYVKRVLRVDISNRRRDPLACIDTFVRTFSGHW